MLAITADDRRRARTRHQVRAGLEHRIDLLVHHQLSFAIGAGIGDGKHRQPAMDHLTGLERQHGAGEPGKEIDRISKHGIHRDIRGVFEFERTLIRLKF